MYRTLGFAFSLPIFVALSGSATAQDVPPDCMASFDIKADKVSIDISWILATGNGSTLSCGAAEFLRERLFIEGDKRLGESELAGSPEAAQTKAIAALSDLETKVQQLPGESVPGVLFTAGGYLVAKYILTSCLLTIEAAGGTCWGAAATFIGATYRFFQKVYTDENNTLAKQDLLSKIQSTKLILNSVNPGEAEKAGARVRWVETQTNLCRAIQRDCL